MCAQWRPARNVLCDLSKPVRSAQSGEPQLSTSSTLSGTRTCASAARRMSPRRSQEKRKRVCRKRASMCSGQGVPMDVGLRDGVKHDFGMSCRARTRVFGADRNRAWRALRAVRQRRGELFPWVSRCGCMVPFCVLPGSAMDGSVYGLHLQVILAYRITGLERSIECSPCQQNDHGQVGFQTESWCDVFEAAPVSMVRRLELARLRYMCSARYAPCTGCHAGRRPG